MDDCKCKADLHEKIYRRFDRVEDGELICDVYEPLESLLDDEGFVNPMDTQIPLQRNDVKPED